jgi:signal transduction histidine kinase
MLKGFRHHLYIRMFLSYMLIIIVWVLVFLSTTPFTLRSAFKQNFERVALLRPNALLENVRSRELYNTFRTAAGDSMRLGSLAAFLTAVVVSSILSYQMVAPAGRMMSATQRIAEGHYDERVPLPDDAVEADLNEWELLALRFNQMAENLQHTEEMRRRLIGDVAHELRTPLTSIKGSMEGLVDGVLPPIVETFQQIYSEADRLQRLVADLQELSRVEAGQTILQIKPIAPRQLAASVAARLAVQFEEKGVHFNADISEELPMVAADEDRIGQVLINLVGNALQYTPAGGSVALKAAVQEKVVHFSICDTGIGVAPEHIPHLFDRFYRVDKSRARAGGGSGIGLTIARHLVEAHGGRIWVSSPGPGEGSTFSFTLPVAKI